MNIHKQLKTFDKDDLIYIMKKLEIKIPNNSTKKMLIKDILKPLQKKMYRMYG